MRLVGCGSVYDGSVYDGPVRVCARPVSPVRVSVCVSAQPCRAVWGLSALWGAWWVCVWMVHGISRIRLAYMYVLFGVHIAQLFLSGVCVCACEVHSLPV